MRKLNSTIVFETFISSEIPWFHSRIFIIGSHLGGGRYRECLFVIGWEAGVRALGSVERWKYRKRLKNYSSLCLLLFWQGEVRSLERWLGNFWPLYMTDSLSHFNAELIWMGGSTKRYQEFWVWELEGVRVEAGHLVSHSSGLPNLDWDVFSIQTSFCWRQNVNSDVSSVHWELTFRDQLLQNDAVSWMHEVKLIQTNPKNTVFNTFLCS